VRNGCDVHTVPVAGAVSGVMGAVSEILTRGLPVTNPSRLLGGSRTCVARTVSVKAATDPNNNNNDL
jgi:hypothetical protein